MFDPDAYRVDDRQLDAIFNDTIKPIVFGNCTRPSSDPLLVLVGAQPGAGKSRLCAALHRRSTQQIVEIIGDDLRPYHPNYQDLLSMHPAAMPDATAQAAGAWIERSIDYAVEHRISALVEGTFRNPQVPLDTARRFRGRGFRVEVHLLAVAPEVSRLSIADRYVTDAQLTEAARFTSVDAHEIALHALPETLRALHEPPSPVHRFYVRDRSGGALYDSDRPLTPGGSGFDAMLEIASREWWRRPMGISEFADWQERADRVTGYLRSHHAADLPVRQLVTQLELDRKFLYLASTAPVYGNVERGKLLSNGEVVEPRVRADEGGGGPSSLRPSS